MFCSFPILQCASKNPEEDVWPWKYKLFLLFFSMHIVLYNYFLPLWKEVSGCFYVCKTGINNKKSRFNSGSMNVMLSRFLFNAAMVVRNWPHGLEVTQAEGKCCSHIQISPVHIQHSTVVKPLLTTCQQYELINRQQSFWMTANVSELTLLFQEKYKQPHMVTFSKCVQYYEILPWMIICTIIIRYFL